LKSYLRSKLCLKTILQYLEEAISRVKNVTAPMNYERKGFETPCALTGNCQDCKDVKYKKCSVMVIHEAKPRGIKNFYIILVKENLGY